MFFLRIENKSLILQSQIANGTLTERLGNGLQNREEQFDSARYLTFFHATKDATQRESHLFFSPFANGEKSTAKLPFFKSYAFRLQKDSF